MFLVQKSEYKSIYLVKTGLPKAITKKCIFYIDILMHCADKTFDIQISIEHPAKLIKLSRYPQADLIFRWVHIL